MIRTFSTFGMVLAGMLLAAGVPVNAQQDPNAAVAAQTERTKAETEKIKADTDKINAEANRDRARVSALGLPAYNGTTKLNPDAGDIEAMLLTAPAVRLAGKKIADAMPPGTLLLLTQADTIDFGVVGSLTAEMDGLMRQYEALGFRLPGPVRGPAINLTGGAIAVISAIAGMVRSDTEVTAANVPVGDTMLVAAVAAQLKNAVRLPASAISTVEVNQTGANSPLLTRLGNLAKVADLARTHREALANAHAGKPTDAEKATIAALDDVQKRYDMFFSRVTTVDGQGVVPIARAARLELLMSGVTGVLRVHVEKAGGSLTTTKNLATFFGADPVRISGGIVVSYVLTVPSTGAVSTAGILGCRTAVARLREVQERRVSFDAVAKANQADCE